MKFDRSKILGLFSVLLVFSGTLALILVGDEAGSSQSEPLVKSITSSGCLLDEHAIEDFKKARLILEEKERSLQLREAELKSAQSAFEEELNKLSLVRKEIEKIQSLHKKDQEENISKLVEAFETMSPKASAQLLSRVDEVLAVEAMSKISTQKLAKIMNIMESEPLSKLTERLAGVTQSKKTILKGGEKNDGRSQLSTSRSSEPIAEHKPASEKTEKSL
jgi:flagellar motility protein MotE (MotC chaperone)